MTDTITARFRPEVADAVEERSGRATKTQSGLPLHFSGSTPLRPVPSTQRAVTLVAKRAMDLVVSVVALLFLTPLLLFVAMAIRATSAGPALFFQVRPGLNGVPFKIWKFRTMYIDQSDTAGSIQAVSGDRRITPIGRFLRRTSIDELPQLINVILGDMSLIGPRPHPVKMLAGGVAYEQLVKYYDMRLLARPGISGWAQANGLRGETKDPLTARARIDHDIAYIQNLSILLDLKIIWLTLRHEFLKGTGA